MLFVRPVHTEEALLELNSLAEGSHDVEVDCCAPERLSTFHHCRFFTRLSILENVFLNVFFPYKTATCFESHSAGCVRCFSVLQGHLNPRLPRQLLATVLLRLSLLYRSS